MSNFPNDEFFRESFSIFFNPIMQELQNRLSIKIPEEVQNLFTKSCALYNKKESGSIYEVVRSRDKRNNSDYFYNLLHMGVQDGIAATCYNLNTFMFYCDLVREKGHELIQSAKPSRPMTLGIPAQKIIFEYEHFTLHSRIVLDRLNWFLNYFFLTDTRNLFRLYKDLSTRSNKSHEAFNVLEVIDKHRPFLDELISTDKSEKRTERDQLAHREEIQFTSTNIIAMPDGTIKVRLICKDEPFKNDADIVLKERFNHLIDFTLELLNAFFNFY